MDHPSSSSTSPDIALSSSSISPDIPACSTSTQPMNIDIDNVTDFNEKYTTDSICAYLKYKKTHFMILDKNSAASCWKQFGLPAKILGPNKYEIIKRFASCKSCYQTYSYSSTTTTLSNHKCPVVHNGNQLKLQVLSIPKPTKSTSLACGKANEKQKSSFVSLVSDWVCSGTRPISMIEDDGLKNVVDYCIQTGYKCGPIAASSLLPCRKTISKEIKRMANVRRNEMKKILIAAARARCLSLSPDLWSDGYKKMSYLGCTAQWIDHQWDLCSFELFCLPYRKPNKTAANVLLTIEEGLALYDLQPFMYDIIWVCDRGSNLKKALEKFPVVHCIGHRLNNTLQKVFFQAETTKAKKDVAFGEYYLDMIDDEDDQISENSSDEEDDAHSDDDKSIDKRNQVIKRTSAVPARNTATATLSQLPPDPKRILVTIIHCKELVQYVKKVNLNQDLEDRHASVVVQSTIVRWLSLYNCLQSVRKALNPLTEIFDEKHLDKKRINVISVSLLEKLIEFLKPWTFVMKRVQSSLTPSIHTVTPSISVINSSLENKSSDPKQDKSFNFFRQRAKQLIKEMIQFDPIHLMGTFFNPKTRKMQHLSTKQREECIEYVKQEMLLFDTNQQVESSSNRKQVQLSRTTSSRYMMDFYINAENNDDADNQQTSSKTSSHAIEIDLYLKHGSDKTTSEINDGAAEEYDPLSFWKKRYGSYPVLAKVAARVFAVPATSAAVEREFSFSGNIITQKRSRLSPDTVSDIVFNHSYKIFKEKFGANKTCDLIEL